MLKFAVLAVLLAGPLAAQCTFILTPTSASFSAAGGNDQFFITASQSTCARTATTNASWITISFGSPGTGSGSVGFSVQPNSFLIDRTGTITVGNAAFTVTQAAGTCSYSISPSSASVVNTGNTGSFNLTATNNGCAWNITNNNPDWITITSASSGSGSITIRYSAAPNPTTSTRSGTIGVGGQTFTLTQTGQCGFTANPAASQIAAAGATGSFQLQASAASCAWVVSSGNADWLTITSAFSGTGTATIAYAVAGNATGADRLGTITAGGTTFSVFQAGSSCAYSLQPPSFNLAPAARSVLFSIATSCPWIAISNTGWITIVSAGSGAGNGTVTFVVNANQTAMARTGSISVGSQTLTVIQAGIPCNVSITPGSLNFPGDSGSGSISVFAAAGCDWAVSTTANWITLGGAGGTGSGDVLFTVTANFTQAVRTATIAVANQTFTVQQASSTCAFQLFADHLQVPASGGGGTFSVVTPCAWTATPGAPWITIQSGQRGLGNGDVTFAVSRNNGPDPRNATIAVGDQMFTVLQPGQSCTLALTPDHAGIAGAGGRGSISVTAVGSCRWQPAPGADWITIPSWSSINGSGTVNYLVAQNPAAAVRSATIAVGSETFTLTQGPLEVQFTASQVVNAASRAAGAIAPGEIVTITGTSIGPVTPAVYQIPAPGQTLATTLGGTQVLFDGVAAPLLYVSSAQVNCIVPYGVSGRQATQVVIAVNSVISNPALLAVSGSAPGIFTTDLSGQGQAAVLNQDNTVNSARNPASRNTVLQIYATGAGQTTPESVDGAFTGGTPPSQALPVRVSVGGMDATWLYAGAAPLEVAGMMQVNVLIPRQVTPGNAVPVTLQVGDATSPVVTVAIK